jgi:hypothetical protein
MAVSEQAAYAPILAPSSGLHWARRKARDHAPTSAPSQVHMANAKGRLLCDGGPSVSRGIAEPTLRSEVHSVCMHVYRRDHAK